MASKLDLALKRVMHINWSQYDLSRANSHFMLIREYLRRATFWAKNLNCPDKWPFFDIPGQINPSIRANPEKVQIFVKKRSRFDIETVTCEWYLHWVELEETIAIQDIDQVAPYEPLIWFYERGGA